MSVHSYLELMPSVATRAVTVRMSRQLSAPIECVFDAWLDPVTAGSFLFATDAGEVVRAEIDARTGGRFTFVRRENGTEVRRSGAYISIDRPHLLAFTLSDNTRTLMDDRVIIEVASVGLGSLLVLTHEMGLERYAERHRIESEWRRRLGMLAFLCPIPRCADFSPVQPRSVPVVQGPGPGGLPSNRTATSPGGFTLPGSRGLGGRRECPSPAKSGLLKVPCKSI